VREAALRTQHPSHTHGNHAVANRPILALDRTCRERPAEGGASAPHVQRITDDWAPGTSLFARLLRRNEAGALKCAATFLFVTPVRAKSFRLTHRHAENGERKVVFEWHGTCGYIAPHAD
jgi:hypothetical protein